jgi:hypothetical protein
MSRRSPLSDKDLNKLTVEELVEIARAACAGALESKPLAGIAARLPDPAACFEVLKQRGAAASTRWQAPGDDLAELGRCLLLRAALASLDHVSALQVSDRVKKFLVEDFMAYADPPAKWNPMFVPSHIRYGEMVRLVTFRRFPAGQFHWETAAFPGSFLLKASTLDAFRLVVCLAKAGGRAPVWEVHLNDRRPNAFLILEKGAKRSYYRMAKSMEMQPEVKAITVCSWLYSQEAAAVSPHLSWLRTHYEENGATVADLDLAPQDSGFLLGDARRKALHEEGKFHPRFTVAVWPRAAVLRWAGEHPELAED